MLEFRMMPIEKLYVGHINMRKSMLDTIEIEETAKKYGILEPITVRPDKEGMFEVIMGQRRFLGAKRLGLKEVPVLIRKLNDIESLEVSVIENITKEQPNLVDFAESIKKLVDYYRNILPKLAVPIVRKEYNIYAGVKRVSEILGKNRRYVWMMYNLASYSKLVKQAISSLRVDYHLFLIIKSIPDKEKMVFLDFLKTNHIIRGEYEHLIRTYNKSKEKDMKKTIEDFLKHVKIRKTISISKDLNIRLNTYSVLKKIQVNLIIEAALNEYFSKREN